MTLPTDYYPHDDPVFAGRVFWTAQARQIWKLINADKEIPAQLLRGTSTTAEAPPSASQDDMILPGEDKASGPESPTVSESDAAPGSAKPGPG